MKGGAPQTAGEARYLHGWRISYFYLGPSCQPSVHCRYGYTGHYVCFYGLPYRGASIGLRPWGRPSPFTLCSQWCRYWLSRLLSQAPFMAMQPHRRDYWPRCRLCWVSRQPSAVSLVIQGANQPGRATWQTILAVATSLFAATTVFTELKSSLDVIWDAPKNQQQGIFALIRSRLLSFGIVLSVGFILLVSLLLSTVIAAVESRYGQWFGMSVTVLSLISNLVTTLIVTLLFAAIFKLLPACPVAWKDVWRGAFLTACLYMLGKGLIAMYLGTTALASSYGAAGTLVLILLWMYYSAQVFLYGAELSRAMAQQRVINESEEEAVHLAQAAPSLHT